MLSRIRRLTLWAFAVALVLSSWAVLLDPGEEAAASEPWDPGEPPASNCGTEGLAPGTSCVESWRHVHRDHTYVFDASIWATLVHLINCHGPPYIDPIGPGTGGVYDSNGMLVSTNPAEFQKTAVLRRKGHVVPSAPSTEEDWEEIEGQSFYGDWCALQMENFYTVESYSVSPSSPHQSILSTVVETCTDDQLTSLRGRPSGSTASLTPAFSATHVGYHLALASSDSSGWLTAVPQGCATLQWLTAADSTLGSWHIFDVGIGASRTTFLWAYGTADSTAYAVIMSRADCGADEHHHDTTDCHDHPMPACTADGTYTTIDGDGHSTGTTTVCTYSNQCATDEHAHGLIACHVHLRPTCTDSGTYTTIDGTGHSTGTTTVCAANPCTNHQHIASPGSPGSPGLDLNGDGDYNDLGEYPPVPGYPPTYYTHAHCRPLCAWPTGAHYLVHTGGDNHGDAYELCPAASAPSLSCAADGVAGHGDAVSVRWNSGTVDSFDYQYRYTADGAALSSTNSASSSGTTAQINLDSTALDTQFGAAQRGVEVRVSATRHSWSPWSSVQCGISCTAALDNLSGDIHVIAGYANAAEPRLSVGLEQVVEPARDNLMYLIYTATGAVIDTVPTVNECRGHQVAEWDWSFSSSADFALWTDWVSSHSACTRGGSSCRYRVVDSDAVGNTFTVTATPQGRTKLAGTVVSGSPVTVTVRVGYSWLP